jgi:hypothetical protein
MLTSNLEGTRSQFPIDHTRNCDPGVTQNLPSLPKLTSLIPQFASLPRLYLFPHWFEISLHTIHPYRNAIDERKRLRVRDEHRSERSRDNAAKRGTFA